MDSLGGSERAGGSRDGWSGACSSFGELWRGPSFGYDRHVLDITVSEGTSGSPEQVLAAATDLSEERVKVWSNSKPRYFQVHAQGAEFAELTEGFRPPFGRVWQRSRYEWEPGSIRQTVIDSNVLAPGSTWELKFPPSGGGCTVEMRLRREFRRSAKGRIASAINHLGGRHLWGWYLRKALAEVENRSS